MGCSVGACYRRAIGRRIGGALETPVLVEYHTPFRTKARDTDQDRQHERHRYEPGALLVA